MDRRRFLTILAATVATGASARFWPALSQEHAGEHAAAAIGQEGYTFLTDPEIQFIEAAIDRLIPADDLGPGALGAGVAIFIDRQLDGTFGHAGRFYNQGPWGQSSALQGYQLPLAPRELFQIGIAATDEYCRAAHGRTFAQLEGEQQDEVLRGLADISDDRDLEGIPGVVFFAHLIQMTKDGFFADPIYGGNRGMVGWKLVGFPGVAADYTEWIHRTNEPYIVEPVGIEEMEAGLVPRDHHGHPVHRRADAASVKPTAAPALAPGASRHVEVSASFHGIVGTLPV